MLQVQRSVTEVFRPGRVCWPNTPRVSLPPLQQKVVVQRVCECTWTRCFYDPLRSSARLTFHVAFSTATRGHSQLAECEPTTSNLPPPPTSHHLVRRGEMWTTEAFQRAGKISGGKTSWKFDLDSASRLG